MNASPPTIVGAAVLDEAVADYLLQREQDPTTVPSAFAERLPAGLRSPFLAEVEHLGELDRLTDAPPRDLPQRLGGYRLIGPLGEGATGTVHEAEQVSLGRRVAIKVLHECVVRDAAARRRFVREARVAASLRHPAIVGIHDFGEQDGKAYLVMQLAPGRSLRLLLHARANPEHVLHADAVRLLEDPQRIAATCAAIAEAMAYAHARGVVHRDLKPANLMLDDDGLPTVLDFGLARANGDLNDSLTRTGDVLGTPLYMAPEQLVGDRSGPQTDIWALGCILLECLTGRPPAGPFSVDTDELPSRLTSIIERCLASEPERRYGSAAELATALRRFATGYSHCCSWRWTKRVRRRAQRTLLAAAAAVACWWAVRVAVPEPPAVAIDGTSSPQLTERLDRLERELSRLAADPR